MDLFTARQVNIPVTTTIPPGITVEAAQNVICNLLENATFEEIQLLNELIKDGFQRKIAINIARAKYGHLIL